VCVQVALLNDPQGSYQKAVNTFATDQKALDDAFMHAWYKVCVCGVCVLCVCVCVCVCLVYPVHTCIHTHLRH
jgi:catalase (peroxidase I)